jgi:hypothetical protein
MRKLTILIICIKMITLTVIAQQPTKLGVHGVTVPSKIVVLGAKIVRYGFTDYQIKNAFISGDSTIINKIQQIDSIGVEQVVFLRYPEDTIDVVGVNYERIPSGTDSIEVLQYLDTFLMTVGPYIDWIQINQEPLGATQYNYAVYSREQVLNWWRTLAIFIESKITSNPDDLNHLKIVTGGITFPEDTLNSNFLAAVDSIIQFGEDYCDAIDIHLNVSSLQEGIDNITFIKNRTNHTLVSTEWCQAHASTESGWLAATNSIYPPPLDTLTNYEVIERAYDSTMTIDCWDSLIATSPYSQNFISDFYSVLDSNCFLFACYAAGFQYGNPVFDWRALFTNRVTTGVNYYNNQPFHGDFVNLADAIDSGYTTNCIVTTTYNLAPMNQFAEIYPNPANNILFIKYMQNTVKETQLEIYNTFGQLIYSQNKHKYTEISTIDISQFAIGLYIVRIISDTQTLYETKLMITK